MDIIGLIAEYNPFHNGHLYQINKIKEMYPQSIIILVLNGYFLERGEISYITKEEKTKLALDNKIDLVVELPFVYGNQSADTFTYQSINILNKLKINKLIFGSESNNINKIKAISTAELDYSYNIRVKDYLDSGLNYPSALAKALNINFDFKPNDLLAISYVKAINLINKKIEPICILRTNDYHDIKSNENVISAANIRNKLINKEDISKYIPYKNNIIIPNYDLYFKILKQNILTNKNLAAIVDVDEGIENLLLKKINTANNFDEFIKSIKTKRYTYNKLNRMFIHILINFTKQDKDNLFLNYIHILGFNSFGKDYLNKLNINVKPKKTDLIYQYELKAALIYDLINNTHCYNFE